MFEASGSQGDGDPFADVMAGLPTEVEPPGYDPEHEAWLGTLAAGYDNPSAADLEVEIARDEAWQRTEAALLAEWDQDPQWRAASAAPARAAGFDRGADPDASVHEHPAPAPDAHPVDADPVDADPVDADPVDADPVDADPVDADPVDAAAVAAGLVDADLDDEALLTALQDAHRAIATAQARRAAVITELAHRRAKDAVTELTGRKAKGHQALTIGARALGEEVALELCLSKPTAGTLVDTCVGLCTECPDTLDYLARGEIDWDKATAIVHLAQTIKHAQANTNPDLDPEDRLDPEELAKALEEELLKNAGKEPVAALRRRAAQAMVDVNTRAAEQRHRVARSHRQFWFSPDEDSMCRLGAYLPADTGMRIKHAITRLAHHARNLGGAGDKRTLDQLRVDAMADALIAAADNLHPDNATTSSGDSSGAAAPGTTDPGTPDHAGPRDSRAHGPGDTSARTENVHRRTDDTARDDRTIPDNNTSPDDEDRVPNGNRTTRDDSTSLDGNMSPDGDTSPGDEGRVPDTDATLDDELATTEYDLTDEDDLSDPRPLSPNPQTYSRTTPTTRTTTATGHSNGPGAGSGPGSGPGRGRSGSDPRVIVTIAATTLAGQDDHPGYLHGFGPIVASMARDVAATGTWRCAITDDVHGTLLGLGTSTYTPNYKPTAALRRFLITRDRICRVAGCTTPAELCDVDHCTPWPAGATCECCAECLCGSHHRMKHETGFTLTPSTNPNDPPGTLYWTTPAGHPFPSYPAQLDPHPPGKPGPVKPGSSTPKLGACGCGTDDSSSPEPGAPGPDAPGRGTPESNSIEPGAPGSNSPEPGAPEPGAPGSGTPRSSSPAPSTSDPEACTACGDADAQIATEEAATRAFEEERRRARDTDVPSSVTSGRRQNRNHTTGHPNSFGMHDWEEDPDGFRYDTPEDRIIDPFRHHPDQAAGFAERRAANDARIAALRREYQIAQDSKSQSEEVISPINNTPTVTVRVSSFDDPGPSGTTGRSTESRSSAVAVPTAPAGSFGGPSSSGRNPSPGEDEYTEPTADHDRAPDPDRVADTDIGAAPAQSWRSSLHAPRSTIHAIAAVVGTDCGPTHDGPPPF